jgi:gas vesicle protein
MSLTKDDLKQIKGIVTDVVTDVVEQSETRIKSELRDEFQDGMKSLEYTLREEIQYNRREIQSVRKHVEDLSKEIADVNENRTEDTDDAFTDIIKNTADIKDLDGRVFKLENQLA